MLQPTQWETVADIVQRLQISTATLTMWIKRGLPAHSPPGARSLRFDPVEVDDWLRGHDQNGFRNRCSETSPSEAA